MFQGVLYGQCPSRTTFRDPYGWLVTLINAFGAAGGFQATLSHVVDPPPSPFLLAHILAPWGKCIEYVIPDTIAPILKQLMKVCVGGLLALIFPTLPTETYLTHFLFYDTTKTIVINHRHHYNYPPSLLHG